MSASMGSAIARVRQHVLADEFGNDTDKVVGVAASLYRESQPGLLEGVLPGVGSILRDRREARLEQLREDHPEVSARVDEALERAEVRIAQLISQL